jgi:endonuclease V-like protein UPF0215 family
LAFAAEETETSVQSSPMITSPPLPFKEMRDPRRISKRVGKPVLLIFFTNWSSISRDMEEQVLRRADIQDFLQVFHIQRIDAETKKHGIDLSRLFRLERYPTIIAYSDAGRIGSIEGMWPPRAFLRSLQSWYEQWRTLSEERRLKYPADPILKPVEMEKRTKRELRNISGFQLQTGKIVEGIPINLSSGIVTLENDRGSHIIPLHLFTPQSRKKVEANAKKSMLKTMDLVPGPHGLEFNSLGGIIEINTMKEEIQEPFIVLVDPTQEFQSILSAYLEDQPLKRNELTYMRKFKVAENLSERALNLIKRHYSLELPALMVLSKDKPMSKYTELMNPGEFFKILRTIRLRKSLEEQASADSTGSQEQ